MSCCDDKPDRRICQFCGKSAETLFPSPITGNPRPTCFKCANERIK
jgi:hypothetical protein